MPQVGTESKEMRDEEWVGERGDRGRRMGQEMVGGDEVLVT